IDGAGRLVDNAGHFVLDTAGEPIVLEDPQFTVEANGTVIDNGAAVGQIQIAYAANPLNLVKEGGGLFRNEDEAVLPSAVGNEEIGYQLKQRFLEGSNVDVEKSMVQLMDAFRTLQANQEVLKAYDKTMGLAVNKVGRIG
ncbi:MAG TPA: flagellar basal body rod C-terminal domain-containing protein, partial [Bacillales bacterium]